MRRNNWKPSTASRVCHLHFHSSDFIQTPRIKRKILKINAVPTINMGYDEETENNPLNDLFEAIKMQTSSENRKCKACCHECHEYLAKIKKLEEENVEIKRLQQEENKNHVEELKRQVETFNIILKKDKEAMQKKLNTANLKSKLLIRKTKRRDKEIKNLTNVLEILKEKT